MFNQRIFFIAFFFLTVFCVIPCTIDAKEAYVINSRGSLIDASVRYTFIGIYHASFEDFAGVIQFDEKDIANSSVEMVFKTKSLYSNYSILDGIVKSGRLLNAEQFPEIRFISERIEKKGKRFSVTGTLDLHGVKKTMSFPFELQGPIYELDRSPYLKAHGSWRIPRKDFNIIWSKVLDYGGIIVGNHVTLDWGIVATK